MPKSALRALCRYRDNADPLANSQLSRATLVGSVGIFALQSASSGARSNSVTGVLCRSRFDEKPGGQAFQWGAVSGRGQSTDLHMVAKAFDYAELTIASTPLAWAYARESA
jgi:hypothetical protein